MFHDHNHSDLAHDFYQEQKEIFDSSDCGVYAYLDDTSRVCNEKFAKLLGYATPAEWAGVDTSGSFPEAFVEAKSQETLVSAYQDAMERMVASEIEVTWKKKTGGVVKTTVILVPIVFEGHVFALHFVA